MNIVQTKSFLYKIKIDNKINDYETKKKYVSGLIDELKDKIYKKCKDLKVYCIFNKKSKKLEGNHPLYLLKNYDHLKIKLENSKRSTERKMVVAKKKSKIEIKNQIMIPETIENNIEILKNDSNNMDNNTPHNNNINSIPIINKGEKIDISLDYTIKLNSIIDKECFVVSQISFNNYPLKITYKQFVELHGINWLSDLVKFYKNKN
eukprot:TRINITY_DN8442_c0_g1_i1.p1 TRINITY_DN8442_c0_g1~~TRINITY_DN8442_c0_g1_i1.p1  ORF type:complete len:231 (+),score=67.84 TRINITY_DN8442_c0_g1_i1:77-694(+)